MQNMIGRPRAVGTDRMLVRKDGLPLHPSLALIFPQEKYAEAGDREHRRGDVERQRLADHQ